MLAGVQSSEGAGESIPKLIHWVVVRRLQSFIIWAFFSWFAPTTWQLSDEREKGTQDGSGRLFITDLGSDTPLFLLFYLLEADS